MSSGAPESLHAGKKEVSGELYVAIEHCSITIGEYRTPRLTCSTDQALENGKHVTHFVSAKILSEGIA